MAAKVIQLKDPLDWFRKSLEKKLYYYKELLELFDFVERPSFAMKCSFVCKRCGHTAGYIREDEAEYHNAFIIVLVHCNNCQSHWKKQGLEPFYVRMFEDWDLSKQVKWVAH